MQKKLKTLYYKGNLANKKKADAWVTRICLV